jgi:hypothetical protein
MPVAIDTSVLISAERQDGLERGDKLLVLDSDFDRLKDRIQLLNPRA